MRAKPTIAIVGPGNLGSAMARALHAAGYVVEEIVHHGGASRKRTAALARSVGARPAAMEKAQLTAEVIWICVSDGAIAACASELAQRGNWRGKIALHASGALSSSELKPLRGRGAAVASLHPMMTFVQGVTPDLRGVTFALEGDARAVRAARRIAGDLGGRAVAIDPRRKPLYHAFGAFTSPLIVAVLAAAERVAKKAGLKERTARAAMGPIVRQTVGNYLARGKAGAFSGPLVRGDVATVKRHLQVLRAAPEAREAYVALAKSALSTLPVKRKREIQKILKHL